MTAPGSAPEYVVVARVAGAHGVLGWVRIVSFTEPPENLLSYRPWFIAEGDGWQPLNLADVKPHGQGYVAKLRNVSSRDQAQALTGRLIAVPRARLPALEEGTEYYWRDLIGLTVVDVHGRCLGQVDHLIETGANDVLVVKHGDTTSLIPFLARFVVAVDIAAGQMRVDWQEPT